MTEEPLALIALLSVVALIIVGLYSLRLMNRNDFLRQYTRELEAKVASLTEELKESQRKEKILADRIDSIDKGMKTLGYHQLHTRLKQFFLSH